MQVSDLRLYPVKSCRGVSVETAKIGERGFERDRRAMIVAADGTFLSQRSHPRLAQIDVDTSDGLALHLPHASVPVRLSQSRATVRVWSDALTARVAEPEVNAHLSDFLEESVRLVVMDTTSQRQTDPTFGPARSVSFADGFPYLITTTASLNALQETAGEPIPMDRFRPNIVIETETPWSEDEWQSLQIGDQVFDLVKPCTRCVVTTLDQTTGETVGQSTMTALVATRARSGSWGKGVIFGVNAVARTPGGLLRRGMPVEVR